MFERAGRIKKWLEGRNYAVTYAGTDFYRYNDNFHAGGNYTMDCYRISNGYEIRVKTEGKARFWLIDKSHNFAGMDFSQESFIKQFDKVFPYRVKSLDEIKGFDDVGIGVIWCDEGGGEFILCKDLVEYDLTNIQIYRYNTFCRTMNPTESLKEDSRDYVYCAKRSDLESRRAE